MATDCAYTHGSTWLLNIDFFLKVVEFSKAIILLRNKTIFRLSEFLLPFILGVYVHYLNMRVKICYKELELRCYSIWKYLRPCLSKGCDSSKPHPIHQRLTVPLFCGGHVTGIEGEKGCQGRRDSTRK